ncbi:MAG: sigma-70 family RNA polymerase sigma factor [Muribaculaceae bacterium]|nr:sigma-70 family RNA polymerase sigma factor [Muribaculaceae bacterium]
MTTSELEILFKTHYAAMFRLAMSLLYDEDESKDVVSDVFASLLDGGMAIRSDNARGFLLTCVRNSCINVIRHKHMRERFIRLYSNKAEPLSDGPDDSLMLNELRDYINKGLPPLSRRIFTLRYLHDMTCQQVADVVGVSRVTVHHHLSQSLEKINAYFNNTKQ